LSESAIPLREQYIAYTSFKRPSAIYENNYAATYTYNGSEGRVKMELKKNGVKELTRYYISDCYEIDDRAVGGIKEKLYLGGDFYSAPAVYVKNGSSGWQLYYICRDYLGSITHITDSSGSTIEQLSYDAWGRLRNWYNQDVYMPGDEQTLFLGRGYTGHEHLPQFGLINMNARLYDPAVGRFLAPDPYVQAPDFSQNFNRYSYCLNNPLRYTDPSGKFLTWGLSRQGFSIGFNLTPIGVPLGLGINVGWRDGGSVGVYASYELLNAGANGSYTYDMANRQGNWGWGVNGGINLGGNDAWGLGLTVGYGSNGLNLGLGGYYNPWAWQSNPDYDSNAWDDGGAIQNGNNCYSYALDNPNNTIGGKPQPGEYSGAPYSNLTLEDITVAAIRDGRIKKPNFWNKLGFGKRGYYAVYLVLDDTGNVTDYHWYRQDKGGTWSQKHGNWIVENKDGGGNLIYNPVKANHNYSHIVSDLNYSNGGRLLWVRK
jgi:RHS repeat-associated protein